MSEGSGFRQNAFQTDELGLQIDVVQASDLNADGRADLVLRDTGTGAASIWHSTGESFLANAGVIDSVSVDWELIGATGMVVIV